ncbi:MAG: hypothetical protein JNL98_34905 [Bryobacterales bacterium]|nr:hypothetical protein [Bryobacterales bacterium]
MFGADAYDPVALRNYVESRTAVSVLAAYLLGFLGPDENSVISLRKAVRDDNDPVLEFIALEALCRLGINDLTSEGVRKMRSFIRDQRPAARVAGARLAGLLATNGVYDGWAHILNTLSKSDTRSAEFYEALQCLGNFRKMGRGNSIYREVLEKIPASEKTRRERIQQYIPKSK